LELGNSRIEIQGLPCHKLKIQDLKIQDFGLLNIENSRFGNPRFGLPNIENLKDLEFKIWSAQY